MALGDILGGLGGIGEGYLRGTNQLQQIQSQQYAQALRALAMQQQMKQQQSAGNDFRTLLGGGLGNPMGVGGPTPDLGQMPLMAPGQVQQQPLPQVPQATTQMNAPGGGLPGIIAQLESGGGRDNASQPPSMVDPTYGQYSGFASQYGKGAEGVNNFAQAELAAKPNATLGDYYSDYVLGTGKPGSHTTADLASTSVPGAAGAYRNLTNNAGVPASTPLMTLLADFKSSIPPQIRNEGLPGARNVLQGSGNPLTLVGRYNPTTLAQAIKKANPDASDEVNMASFDHLFPLLSNAGKAEFAQQWEMYRQGEHEREFGVAQGEKAREFGLREGELQQNRQVMQGFAQQRLDQPTGQPYQPLDAEGKPMGPPGQVKGGVFSPIQGLPQGAGGGLGKVGAKPAGGAVSPSEVDFGVNYFKATGTLPVGTGRNRPLLDGIMTKLGNEGYDANKIAESAGTFKANQSSLAAATKLADAATSFENTALKNLDVATKQLHGAAATDLGPWINKWIETGETQTGNPNVPASVTAVLTFANEYAKVMSGAIGAQGATVDSRREAAELFNPYFSTGQWDAVAKIAKQDMANRKESLYDQVDVIKSRLGRTGASGSPEQGGMKAMPVPDQFKGEADGTSFQGKDGNVWVKKGNQMIQTPGAEVPPGQ